MGAKAATKTNVNAKANAKPKAKAKGQAAAAAEEQQPNTSQAPRGQGGARATTASYDKNQYQKPHPDATAKPKPQPRPQPRPQPKQNKAKDNAKKAHDGEVHACSDATCGKLGAKASCAQCHRAYYCTAACQKRDWPRHKRACRASVAAAARAATRVREATAARAARAAGGGGGGTGSAAAADEKCVICIGPLVEPVDLPCGHAYCAECLAGLRSKGVAQTCPLCRAELPPGVAGLYELAMRAIDRVEGKVVRGEVTWGSLDADSQEEMDECVAMLTEAVAQGHGGAMAQLRAIYGTGAGVAKDEAREEELGKRLMALPGGEGAYQEALALYQAVADVVDRGERTWSTLPDYGQRAMDTSVQNLEHAVDQSHKTATIMLADLYENGHGVARNTSKAASLRRRVAED